MSAYAVLCRTAMSLLTACVCTALTARMGPWAAAGIWTMGIGGVCGLTGHSHGPCHLDA